MISLTSLKRPIQFRPALGADITRHIDISKLQKRVVMLLTNLCSQEVIGIKRSKRLQERLAKFVGGHTRILRCSCRICKCKEF